MKLYHWYSSILMMLFSATVAASNCEVVGKISDIVTKSKSGSVYVVRTACPAQERIAAFVYQWLYEGDRIEITGDIEVLVSLAKGEKRVFTQNKASDKYGRKKVVVLSTLIMAASMLVLALSTTPVMLITAIAIYGLAQGMTSPTLLASATDLSDEKHRGRGISSLYIFMELGIGIGAFLSGFIYANNADNFFVTFLTCSLLALTAFLYLIFIKAPKPPKTTNELTEPITDPL